MFSSSPFIQLPIASMVIPGRNLLIYGLTILTQNLSRLVSLAHLAMKVLPEEVETLALLELEAKLKEREYQKGYVSTL